MLQALHEKLQGTIAWIIVGAIVTTFALWGGHSFFSRRPREGGGAKVNGVSITPQVFSSQYEHWRRQADLKGVPEEALKAWFLQSMIQALVIKQGVRDLGLRAPDLVVQRSIARMPVFQDQGKFSKQKFETVLEHSSTGVDRFLSEARGVVVVEQLREGLGQSAFALPQEVDRLNALLGEKRGYRELVIPASRFLKVSQPSDEEVRAYYEAHLKAFEVPEKVVLEYLELAAPDFEKNADQLTALAYENPSALGPIADGLHLTLQTTPAFTRGDKGWWSAPEVMTVIWDEDMLTGEVNSGPIVLEDKRLVVFRVKRHEPASVRSLAEVKAQIVGVLQQEASVHRAKEQGEAWAKELGAGKSIDAAVASAHLAWKAHEPIGRSDATVDREVVSLVFRLPHPPAYDGVTLRNGDYCLVALDRVVPATGVSASKGLNREKLGKLLGKIDEEHFQEHLMRSAKITRTDSVAAES